MKRNRSRQESATLKNFLVKTHNVFSQLYQKDREVHILVAEEAFIEKVVQGGLPYQAAFTFLDNPEKIAVWVQFIQKNDEKETKEQDRQQLKIIARNTNWKAVYVAGAVMAILSLPLGDAYKAAKEFATKHLIPEGTRKEIKPAVTEGNCPAAIRYYFLDNSRAEINNQRPMPPAARVEPWSKPVL